MRQESRRFVAAGASGRSQVQRAHRWRWPRISLALRQACQRSPSSGSAQIFGIICARHAGAVLPTIKKLGINSRSGKQQQNSRRRACSKRDSQESTSPPALSIYLIAGTTCKPLSSPPTGFGLRPVRWDSVGKTSASCLEGARG